MYYFVLNILDVAQNRQRMFLITTTDYTRGVSFYFLVL